MTGRRLGAISRCSQWWIGDWIRYGTQRWGEKYVQAARITGYDVASLRNMAWVASRFDSSLRSDKLTWSHHALLAPLEFEKAKYWMERAIEERWSVADLRTELRTGQREESRRAKEGEGQKGQKIEVAMTRPVLVCPRCGSEVELAS